jgi:hypothetical protein
MRTKKTAFRLLKAVRGMSGSVLRRVRRVWGKIEWPAIGSVIAFALVLGFIGFSRFFAAVGESRSAWDIFYLTLQLFVLQSGSVSGPVTWELQVARLLAPTVAAYTAVKALATIFGERFERFWLRFYRGHVVICGLGHKGLLLTRSLRMRGDDVVIVEDDAENDRIEVARMHGAVVLIGDSRDPQLLAKAGVRRASHLVAVSGDDGINAEVAVQARNLVAGRGGEPLSCLVHIVDPQLCTMLRMQEIGRRKETVFRLDFFNVFEIGARALLGEHPVAIQGDETFGGHVVIVGLGQFGEHLVAHAARDWWSAYGRRRDKLRITIIDQHACQLTELLHLKYLWLPQACELEPQDMTIESREFREARFLFDSRGRISVSTVYVCLDDDAIGLSTGLTLHRHVKRQGVKIVVRMVHGAGLASLLNDARSSEFAGLHAFELLEGMCNPQQLFAGAYEAIAREIHRAYVADEQRKGVTGEANEAVVPWDELPERFRESNRAQAAHIGDKLADIGCDLAPLTDWEAELFEFGDDEVEVLAQLEHKRWMAEKLRANWERGEKKKGSKTSPYLVQWDELDEEQKEKDRMFIRKLPRFLVEVGLQIVRLDDESVAQ